MKIVLFKFQSLAEFSVNSYTMSCCRSANATALFQSLAEFSVNSYEWIQYDERVVGEVSISCRVFG